MLDVKHSQNGLKRRYTVSPSLVVVGLEYAIRMYHEDEEKWKLGGTHGLIICAAAANDVLVKWKG
jgi:hypothetical protein